MYAIGVDIGGTKIAAGVVDERGNILAKAKRKTAAGDAADEPAWELPLVAKYRRQLDSKIADIKNMGGINAGTITAGLFLEEFTAGVPFGHLDICGPMMTDVDDSCAVGVDALGFLGRIRQELAR